MQAISKPGAVLLRYDTPLVVVGGGAVAPEDVRAVWAPGLGLVGADSGGDAILAAGLVPDAVIGDFDSIADPARFGDATRLIRLEEQQTTDFEKVLYSTAAPLTLALGMTGGRLDHTLAALHAVTRHAAERRIILVDAVDVALAVSGAISLSVPVGTRVSIYPLMPVRFIGSTGLLYPLDGLAMAQGDVIGTSNVATAPEVTLCAETKMPWLLILPRAHLGALTRGV